MTPKEIGDWIKNKYGHIPQRHGDFLHWRINTASGPSTRSLPGISLHEFHDMPGVSYRAPHVVLDFRPAPECHRLDDPVEFVSIHIWPNHPDYPHFENIKSDHPDLKKTLSRYIDRGLIYEAKKPIDGGRQRHSIKYLHRSKKDDNVVIRYVTSDGPVRASCIEWQEEFGVCELILHLNRKAAKSSVSCMKEKTENQSAFGEWKQYTDECDALFYDYTNYNDYDQNCCLSRSHEDWLLQSVQGLCQPRSVVSKDVLTFEDDLKNTLIWHPDANLPETENRESRLILNEKPKYWDAWMEEELNEMSDPLFPFEIDRNFH